MTAQTTRSPDHCPYRRPLPVPVGPANHMCALALGMIGARDPALCPVDLESCTVCCSQREPRQDAPNPMVATTIYKAARTIREAGGVEGCDSARAAGLIAYATKHLMRLDVPRQERSATRETPPYTSACRHLGPQTGEQNCKTCRGNVRQRVFACQHPLHERTTIAECRHCGDYQPGEGRHPVENWAVGMTTAPRSPGTLRRTLSSLRGAGWQGSIYVFAESRTRIEGGALGGDSVCVVRRSGRALGAWSNFLLGLNELYLREPLADAYLMVQDDVLFAQNLRPYLEANLWPGSDAGVVSLHTPRHLAAGSGTGFFQADLGYGAWGAQAFVFSNRALRSFLADPAVVDHRLKGFLEGKKNVDSIVGDWCRRSNRAFWLHAPSLTEHIGAASTLWPKATLEGRRASADFPGDGRPLTELLAEHRQKHGEQAPQAIRMLADGTIEPVPPQTAEPEAKKAAVPAPPSSPAPAAAPGIVTTATPSPGNKTPESIQKPRVAALPLEVVFGMVIHQEPVGQIEWALTWLRRAYPKAPVFVVSDGLHPEETAVRAVCEKHRALFERGERLKGIESGAAWWQRFLSLGDAHRPDWLCKLDPDTWVRRCVEFEQAPEGADLIGRVTSPGLPHENVQGGFQAIRGRAVTRILQSGQCLSPRWRDPASWAQGECRQVIARGEISTDFTLLAILRELGMKWAHHDEIDSHWVAPQHWRSDPAVTHPHKEMTPAQAEPPGISFCTTCYNRLSFLQQTLPKNLECLDRRDEIVLLDYGSTDGLWEWVRTEHLDDLRAGRLKYFRAEVEGWHMAHAKNVAHRQAMLPVVCNLDADNFAPEGYAEWLRGVFARGAAVTHGDATSYGGGYGRIALLKRDFLRLGGYDERFNGWGYDDEDLRQRAMASGIPPVVTPAHYIQFLQHSHDIRQFAPGTSTKEEGIAIGRAITRESLAEGRLRANEMVEWGQAKLKRFNDPARVVTKKIVCVSSLASGVKHRFALLNQVKNFAALYGYEVHFLWGVSRGVASCRWEELFGPIEGFRITNIPEAEVGRLGRLQEGNETIEYEGETYDLVKVGRLVNDRMFAYDLMASGCLERLVPTSARPKVRLMATPSEAIRLAVDQLSSEHQMDRRTGIRIRVSESQSDRRKPRRNQAELEECLRPLLRLDATLPVFIVTDSEYMQQRLAGHFADAVWLPKEFDLLENGTRYVHRTDKTAMCTFLKEVFCLCRCQRVINIGGFLNERAAKIWEPPYLETDAALAACEGAAR